MKLFTPIRSPSFEKRAAMAVRLEGEPNAWPQSIIKEAYKQLPWLQAHEVDVELERVDESRGYAMGKMLIYPAQMQKEAASDRGKLISMPLIVRDRQMAPLDVYLYKEAAHPMDEQRVLGILFRPAVFNGAAAPHQFQGTNISGQYSPADSTQRYAQGIDKKASLLTKIATSTEGLNRLQESLASDPWTRRAFLTSDSVLHAALTDLLENKEKTASDLREARMNRLPPTVIQYRLEGTSLLQKTANHEMYAPKEEKVSRFDVESALSKESYNRLLRDGSLTLVTSPTMKSWDTEKTAQRVHRIGLWETRAAGEKVAGVVIPGMVNFDNKPLEGQIFAGDKTHAIQEKIAGVHLRDVQLTPRDPRGVGCLVYQSGDVAVATPPIRIDHKVNIEKVATYRGVEMAYGSPIVISFVPGLVKIAELGQGEYAVPAEMVWLPLSGGQVEVCAEPGQVLSAEKAKTAAAGVRLISDGASFSFGKTAAAMVFCEDVMSWKDAEFALGALGIPSVQSHGLMKAAQSRGEVLIPKVRPVHPEARRRADMITKIASANLPDLSVDLSRELAWLSKEASVVLGKETVDAVLSLNFVTPENAMTFVGALPVLEKCASKLAEILVASRLGMDDVRENAAKSAMSQVMNVIHGLERLQSRVS